MTSRVVVGSSEYHLMHSALDIEAPLFEPYHAAVHADCGENHDPGTSGRKIAGELLTMK